MRSLPNDGLTQEQMARAIRSVCLEPYFVQVGKDRHVLTSTVYAYLRGHIPVLLDLDLIDINCHTAGDDDAEDCESEVNATDENGSGSKRLVGTHMGFHEVAIVGFSLGLASPIPFEETGLLLRSSRIDKFYAHDDQIGPYARMEIDEHGILETSWRGDVSAEIGTVRAAPGNMLVPLYNKIRISFDIIHDSILPFDQLLEEFRTIGITSYPARLEWDIYLITLNDLKTEVLREAILDSTQRERILLQQLPRFMWRATALCSNSKIIDLLFDATDIKQGRLFLRPIEYDQTLGEVLREVSEDADLIDSVRRKQIGRILEWYLNAVD